MTVGACVALLQSAQGLSEFDAALYKEAYAQHQPIEPQEDSQPGKEPALSRFFIEKDKAQQNPCEKETVNDGGQGVFRNPSCGHGRQISVHVRGIDEEP